MRAITCHTCGKRFFKRANELAHYRDNPGCAEWVRGNAQNTLTYGPKLKAEGERWIEEGQRRIRQAEEMIAEAQELLAATASVENWKERDEQGLLA